MLRHFVAKHLGIIFYLVALGSSLWPLASCSRMEVSESQKKLSVLFVGSSFGVNTFAQFPALATAGGVSITAIGAYQGGMTLKDLRRLIENSSAIMESYKYTSGDLSWINNGPMLFEKLLLTEKWDIIILQRAAPGKDGGSDIWSIDMAEDLSFILRFIEDRVSYQPIIMFNSCFSRPICFFESREEQVSQTTAIMNTAKLVEEDFRISIIPAAVAIQKARSTDLAYLKTSNSLQYPIPDLTGLEQHLDTGVGSYVLGCLLFEQICKPIVGISITEIDYIPTLKDVKGFVFDDKWFTQISEDDAKIAKQCALYALDNPYVFCD